MRGEASHPACPRCGYDLIGLVETWTEACPLEARCSECGGVSPSAALYRREMLGPRWSLEHATRRFVWKWIATTAIAMRPARLWSEFRPEHPVFRVRLWLMAAAWLLALHLLCAAMLGLSWLWLIASGSNAVGPWYPETFRRWEFWKAVMQRLAWPYNGMIELPFAPNQTFANPVYGFVMMSAVPMMMMWAIVGLWLQWPRAERVDRRHLSRALVHSLPAIVLWTLASVCAFCLVGQLETPPETSSVSGVIMLTLLAGFVSYMVWWWRCFAVRYAGRRKRKWLLVVFGILALVLGWAGSVGISELFL